MSKASKPCGKASKTCSTCYNFNHDPWYALGKEHPAGCGEAYEAIASVDPFTCREIIATDPTCPDYLTEQQGTERDAASFAKFEADQLRENTKRNELHHAQASAEQIMQRVLGKLRKG